MQRWASWFGSLSKSRTSVLTGLFFVEINFSVSFYSLTGVYQLIWWSNTQSGASFLCIMAFVSCENFWVLWAPSAVSKILSAAIESQIKVLTVWIWPRIFQQNSLAPRSFCRIVISSVLLSRYRKPALMLQSLFGRPPIPRLPHEQLRDQVDKRLAVSSPNVGST